MDVDAAVQLIQEFAGTQGAVFAIIKHTNVCGVAIRPTLNKPGTPPWQETLKALSEAY